MPARGYRKGVSDRKVPVPCPVRTHITRAELDRLIEAADGRSMTLSRIVRSLVTAFVAGERARLPRAEGPSTAALRELCRIGNNLNQIAHRANAGRLHLIEAEARRVLAAVIAAVARL